MVLFEEFIQQMELTYIPDMGAYGPLKFLNLYCVYKPGHKSYFLHNGERVPITIGISPGLADPRYSLRTVIFLIDFEGGPERVLALNFRVHSISPRELGRRVADKWRAFVEDRRRQRGSTAIQRAWRKRMYRPTSDYVRSVVKPRFEESRA
jgi:hypothetical protein